MHWLWRWSGSLPHLRRLDNALANHTLRSTQARAGFTRIDSSLCSRRSRVSLIPLGLLRLLEVDGPPRLATSDRSCNTAPFHVSLLTPLSSPSLLQHHYHHAAHRFVTNLTAVTTTTTTTNANTTTTTTTTQSTTHTSTPTPAASEVNNMSTKSKQASIMSFVTNESSAERKDIAAPGGDADSCLVDPDYEQKTTINSYHEMEYLLPPEWHYQLKDEFKKPYWKALCDALQSRAEKETILPPRDEIMKAFTACDFSKVRVVIIGQDPYHDIGQAEGLCFSVKRGVKIPPSLVNIYKELESDIPGFKRPSHGSLVDWANQGVLLLNATLTVKAHEANSHSQLGWSNFTKAAIMKLANNRENIVWLLWGGFAQKLGSGVSATRHKILKAGHPSPLSQKSFFGCKHFSQCNQFLKSKGLPEIDWQIKE